MAVLLLIGILVYILLFFASVFFSLKFQFGKEGKDERGKEILNISYGFAFPLVILGWFIISLINEYMVSLSLESYQTAIRSEEHTSELQSRGHLVCRLLLEKKKLIT